MRVVPVDPEAYDGSLPFFGGDLFSFLFAVASPPVLKAGIFFSGTISCLLGEGLSCGRPNSMTVDPVEAEEYDDPLPPPLVLVLASPPVLSASIFICSYLESLGGD